MRILESNFRYKMKIQKLPQSEMPKMATEGTLWAQSFSWEKTQNAKKQSSQTFYVV